VHLSSTTTHQEEKFAGWKGIYFTKKLRAETLQPGLEFDNFKPLLKSGIFKGISWLNGLFFGVMIGVFWKRESRPI
jgi:hypothetical protein